MSKRKKWNVNLTHSCTASATCEVAAESAEQAEEKARNLASDGKLTWTLDEGFNIDQDEMWAGDIEEVETD